MSYGELLHAGLRVAAHVRRHMASRPCLDSSALQESREVRLPNIVCVSIERSVELIVAMIGIQLAGAVYCPVHVSLPAARKAELYTQTECSVVLTLHKHRDSIAQALDTADSAGQDSRPTGRRAAQPTSRHSTQPGHTGRAAAPHTPRPGSAGLCHLHVGHHREAQGGGHLASRLGHVHRGGARAVAGTAGPCRPSNQRGDVRRVHL